MRHDDQWFEPGDKGGRPRENLAGRKFNNLIAVSFVRRDTGSSVWLFRCACGVEKPIRANKVKSGEIKSCGCMQAALRSKANLTHGETRNAHASPEYAAWNSLKKRCKSPAHRQWKDYGGRGITVCKRWEKSFPAFLADMGRRPSAYHSIHRIDNDGPYSPENCKWADALEQQKYKRNNVWVAIGCRKMIAVEAARHVGINKASFSHLRNRAIRDGRELLYINGVKIQLITRAVKRLSEPVESQSVEPQNA